MNKNLSNENRKVVLIGTGMVGMSYAYALLNQAACDELVLVDIDKDRAGGSYGSQSWTCLFYRKHGNLCR